MLPNDFQTVDDMMHEYGHLLEGYGGIVDNRPLPKINNIEDFYQISWEQITEDSRKYWKTKPKVNFATDFVSGYAGASIGNFMNEKYNDIVFEQIAKEKGKDIAQKMKENLTGLNYFRNYPRQSEDFAESFSLYVLQGRIFRDKAKKSTVLQQKYNWLKTNVFKGKEYDTGNPNWRKVSFNATPRIPDAAQNVGFYSLQDPSFIWDYEFPIYNSK
jgi:hypothetical protein